MTIANISQGSARGLPQALRAAQEAMHLPEVQEMLRRLSEYKLGIFMPHMHDKQTGEFQPLPDDVMQVESGLEVSFQPMEEIANQTDRFRGGRRLRRIERRGTLQTIISHVEESALPLIFRVTVCRTVARPRISLRTTRRTKPGLYQSV